MSLSFKEKSQLCMFVSILCIAAIYLLQVNPFSQANVAGEHIGIFIVAVIASIVVAIVGHSFIAIFSTPEQTDERDRLIAGKAASIKSFVLVAGIILSMMASFRFEGNLILLHLLLATLILAELVDLSVQMFLNRSHV